PEELRTLGKAIMDSIIRQDGRVTDPALNQDVRSIMDALLRRAGFEEAGTGYVINKPNEGNAPALPGGAIYISDGALNFVRRAAQQAAKGDTGQENRSYHGMVAAVLAHELAHQTLGHTRRFLYYSGNPERDLEVKAQVRQQELAADRVGAFYLL